jgi:3-oxoacyl-(acyl-carrier-protein) synthase
LGKGFKPESYMEAREARRRDRYAQFASAAAQEAVHQSGMEFPDKNPGRIGVIVSSAIGGIKALQDAVITLNSEGPRRVSPFLIPMLMSNGAAGMLAIDYGIKGPTFSVVSACASGADGIGTAWMMLRSGVIDAALVGASEATITPIGMAAFDRLGATSRRNEDYSMTPQPFDKNRDGFVMGERRSGAETEQHACAASRYTS